MGRWSLFCHGLGPMVNAQGLRPHRRAATVSSRRAWNTGGWSVSRVQRQRQLLSARPCTFMRASLPRLRTSWNGAMARKPLATTTPGPSEPGRRAGSRRRAVPKSSRRPAISGRQTVVPAARRGRCRKYAGQRGQQEAAAVHYSITLSARCSSDLGIVSRIARAALTLIHSSKAAGCSIGRSLGRLPLRILST